MDASGDAAPSESTVYGQGRSRRRPVNACTTCRARKVKCDERSNGCLNCERLQLNCFQHATDGSTANVEQADTSRAITGIKRKRTFRVCIPCRQSKIKCSGERPGCSRCRQRAATCIYDAETAAEPAWVQSIAPSSSQLALQDADTSSASPSPSQNVRASVLSGSHMADCPSALTWLFASGLPSKLKLRALLEAYFDNVHPIRVFAFVHRPSFMRMLDEGLLTESPDKALLYIMCSLGARFYALDYSESTSTLTRELIHNAGSQWAKIAEQMFFADYSTISVTKLKVLVLLHDHEARLGNYAGSFLLTGLIVRMAHGLQINNESSTDILCKEESNSTNDVSLREARRRLMWACYVVDVWAGSGVDQLAILNDRDIKLQLPCNERQFLLQIPNVTERLHSGEMLDFLLAADIPDKPWENMGISAYYVRIIHIWRHVLRYIKHLDEVQPPWILGAEFADLVADIEAWKSSHPPWLVFSSDNIYIRRASSQLGALYLVHCLYHHVLCDLHRISLPDLFKISEPFVFPPEQSPFKVYMQWICFENAQQVSILTAMVLRHGVKYLSDCIVPSLVYNSSRIMLYYIARILDRTRSDAGAIFNRTIELIEQNNQALREMSQLYPLAEPLYVTTEEWLEKVRESVARGHTTAYIAPQDPSDPNAEAASDTSALSPLSTVEATTASETNAIPAFDTPVGLIDQGLRSNETSNAQTNYSTYVTSSGYPYITATISEPLQPSLPSVLGPPSQTHTEQVGVAYYPGIENVEQPLFDLNDLQNFFEWENGVDAPPSGLEALGPLGWNNISNI